MKSSNVRVITGSAGGLYLKIPPQFNSRPTQDRIRQAIFSSLGAAVIEARVLDLYAGTGALGIEALSRGAASACFVDAYQETCRTIRENLEYCRLSGAVVPQKAVPFLRECKETFDLIFADPPYIKEKYDLSTDPAVLELPPHLNAASTVVWEHDSRNYWGEEGVLKLRKSVRYGETTVSYLALKSQSRA